MKFLGIIKDVEVTGLQFQNKMLSYLDFKYRNSLYKITISNNLISLCDSNKSLIASYDITTGKTSKYKTIDDSCDTDSVLMRVLTKDVSDYLLRLERGVYITNNDAGSDK